MDEYKTNKIKVNKPLLNIQICDGVPAKVPKMILLWLKFAVTI